jgi:hypothetical protein
MNIGAWVTIAAPALEEEVLPVFVAVAPVPVVVIPPGELIRRKSKN